MSARGPIAALLAGLVPVAVLGACIPPTACSLVIVPTEDPALTKLAEDVVPIVSPDDLDPSGWAIVEDDVDLGAPRVSMRLRPEAAERFAAFTRANIGGFVAVAIDGQVISVPQIMSPIEDGEIVLSPGQDEAAFLESFRPCLPIDLLPAGG